MTSIKYITPFVDDFSSKFGKLQDRNQVWTYANKVNGMGELQMIEL